MRKILPILFVLMISQITFTQTKIDEYGKIISDDEYFRLAYFLEQLKEDKKFKGTIVIQKNKFETPGKFLRHFHGVKSFLIESLGISPDRFSLVFGGENLRQTELWLSKSDNEKLKFDAKSLDETLNGKITKTTLFDSECLDCDQVVFINQFIFREGLEYFARAVQANPNTTALIEISKVEYVSKTRTEKQKLVNKIFEVLVKDNKISKNRIKIRFKSGYNASFYIIPKIDKNNKKQN